MNPFFRIIVVLCLTTIPSHSQILKKLKNATENLTENVFDKLSQDPVTTSFKDVDKTKYVENTFGDEVTYLSFFNQPFDEEMGFSLQPGFYEGTFQSFCIKAGTYQPIEGRGRFYAPLKGPKADIISDIIHGYQKSSDLSQQEVQLLLWAIIAKTDFAKMKGPVKATALKLLSTSQIARLSKGALDKLTRNEVNKIANSTEPLRSILEAENNLRSKYYDGVKSYQEYEEIAMRAGVEPIVAGFEAGRWTKHPDGFYIRYFPSGYKRTRTQVYVPESLGPVAYNPSTSIAVPPNMGQRLIQTNLPPDPSGSNTGGTITSRQDPFCEPAFSAAADLAVKEQMIAQNIPGLAIAVFQNGKMVHMKAYGYSDVYEKTPITLETIMKWASISKSVTGVAAAQLEEQNSNNFKVTDLANKYVDNWKAVRYTDTTGKKSGTDNRHAQITIAQLLNNTSGIQQYGKGTRSGDNKFYSLVIKNKDTAVVKIIEDTDAYSSDPSPRKFDAKKAVAVFNKSVLDFDPGTMYHYSSYGFVLAGAAVDKVTPQGYRAWVQSNIIDKAGLSTARVCEEPKPGHAMAKDGMLTASNSGCDEYTIPAGGYESNICDLAKYAYSLCVGTFFDTKKDILWNNSVSSNAGGSINYSYGLNYIDSGANLRVWHGGHGGNVRSHMMFFPNDTTGIAIIAPAVYADLPELSKHVFQALNIRPTLYSGRVHTPLDYCRTDMENDADLFHGVWRKTGDDVLVRTGYEKRGFFDEIDRLKANGYSVVDIETYTNKGKRYWDAVLKKGIPETRLVSDLTLSELKPKIQEMKENGYIVTDIESYIAGNSGRLWGAVFYKSNQQNSALFKLSASELLSKHQAMKANGLKLMDIEAYPVDNDFHWMGIWASGGDSELEMNLKPSDLLTLLPQKRNRGYRLVDLEYYLVNNNSEWRVNAVWAKGSGDEFITGELEDSDGDGEDDDKDTSVFQNFCDHMNTHHTKLPDYELIDWERIDIEVFED